MGIFDILFGKKGATNNSGGYSNNSINLSKEDAIQKINLSKEEVHKICLTKKPLNNLTCRVGIVLDYSYSMSNLYKNGLVQSVVEKILPLAMEFDDNGTMEVWLFNDGYTRMPDISMDNFYGYVDREIVKNKKIKMGGTNYAPVMGDVIRKYMVEDPADIPDYIIFITDGDNFDEEETDRVIKAASRNPIFWQYVGVGDASFNYLEHLDEMTGRYVDNANFFSVENVNKIVYGDLLAEYPQWLQYKEVREMLKRH